MSYASRAYKWGRVKRYACIWPNRGIGRYWKRLLSKRRRKWQDVHQRGLANIESTVNYKTW